MTPSQVLLRRQRAPTLLLLNQLFCPLLLLHLPLQAKTNLLQSFQQRLQQQHEQRWRREDGMQQAWCCHLPTRIEPNAAKQFLLLQLLLRLLLQLKVQPHKRQAPKPQLSLPPRDALRRQPWKLQQQQQQEEVLPQAAQALLKLVQLPVALGPQPRPLLLLARLRPCRPCRPSQ